VPVGFKYIGPKMIETGAMMGGEESGGFGFGMHLPERDGIFTDLMLLDLFIREKAAGAGRSARRSPTSTRSPVRRATGGSTSISTERSIRPQGPSCWWNSRTGRQPRWPAGPSSARRPLDTNDGFKFFAADGSWLLVRFSGTEPLVRVYTEATSSAAVDANLAAGEGIVESA
jgi:phosphomannomutase